MYPWIEILSLVGKGLLGIYLEPMFWLVGLLIGYQYWQLRKSQERMFGVSGFSPYKQVLYALTTGMLGGLIGSLLLILVGLNVRLLGLEYIWPTAIALMLINLRFICFAYAGGLVALASLLFGWPVVDVPQVLVLVAILHITESFLIAISGYSTVPVVLRREDGQMVGAFNLQNFWPLPLVLMVSVAIPHAQSVSGMLPMPDWWPLLPMNLEAPEGHQWIYAMIPVVAALGYGDVAIASQPQVRRRHSAFHLAIYSSLLLVLALLSARYSWLQYVAAFLSPFCHEFLIQWDNRKELKGIPRFVPPAEGIMILDTLPDTPARKNGLKPGDILLELDGRPVNSREQLAEAICYAPGEFQLKILRDSTNIMLKASFMNNRRRLGIITVPEGNEQTYIQVSRDRMLAWEWLKKLLRYISRK